MIHPFPLPGSGLRIRGKKMDEAPRRGLAQSSRPWVADRRSFADQTRVAAARCVDGRSCRLRTIIPRRVHGVITMASLFLAALLNTRLWSPAKPLLPHRPSLADHSRSAHGSRSADARTGHGNVSRVEVPGRILCAEAPVRQIQPPSALTAVALRPHCRSRVAILCGSTRAARPSRSEVAAINRRGRPTARETSCTRSWSSCPSWICPFRRTFPRRAS